jgi:hypothetical protein
MFWEPNNDEPGLKFRVDFNYGWGRQELRAIHRRQHDTLIGELVFKRPHELGTEMPPTWRSPDGVDDLQYLFNALWKAGYRPPEVYNIDNTLVVKDQVIAAKDAHLSDMKLAFDKLLEKL